jgi:hypothetical protein
MPNPSPESSRVAARKAMAEAAPPRLFFRWHNPSGTIHEMTLETPLEKLLSDADQAVEFAQSVRKRWAKKSSRESPQRIADIKVASDGLRRAMKPIRSRIARTSHGSRSEPAESLRAASQRIQTERRKLWKMKLKRKSARRM